MRYLFATTLILVFLGAKLPAETTTVDNIVKSSKGAIFISDRDEIRFARMGQRNDSEITFAGTGPAFAVDIAAGMTFQTTKPKGFTSSISHPNNFIPLKTGTYLLTYNLSLFIEDSRINDTLTVVLGGINDGMGGIALTNDFSTGNSNIAGISVVTDLTAGIPVTLIAYPNGDTGQTLIIEPGSTFSATLLAH